MPETARLYSGRAAQLEDVVAGGHSPLLSVRVDAYSSCFPTYSPRSASALSSNAYKFPRRRKYGVQRGSVMAIAPRSHRFASASKTKSNSTGPTESGSFLWLSEFE